MAEDNWGEKLGAILNNPQAMSQILSIAQSLNHPASPPASSPDAPPQTESPPQPEPPSPPEAAPAPEIDPRLLSAGLRALECYRDPNDPRAALLNALRPFLKSSRSAQLDKAIQIAKLSKMARAALGSLKGGQADV